jgi:hypothetical protein
MTVAKLNTANDLRKPDNGQVAYILTSPPKLVGFPENSEYVYKTSPLGGKKFGLQARKPLRRIVARTPESFEKAPGYVLTHYIDTLECGHQITTYSEEIYKTRRGCQDCLDAQIAAKKPVQRAA